MKKLLLSTFFSACLLAQSAHCEFYAGIGIGAALNDGAVTTKELRNSYENSAAYSFSAGYELPLLLTDVRVEGEYLRIHPQLKNKSKASLDAFMINTYANIPLTPIIDPYAGFGLGITRFEHENAPAYQFMLGAEYELPFMPASVAAEYRYFKVTEDGGARGEIAKLHSNILMLKLRYAF